MRVRVRPVMAALLALTLALAGCSSSTSGQAAVATSAALASSGALSTDAAAPSSAGTSDSTTSSGDSSSSDTSSSDTSSSDSGSSDTSSDDSSSSSSESSDSSSSDDSSSSSEDTSAGTGVPGFNTACLAVAATYASVSLSLLTIISGSGNYNGADVLNSLKSLGDSVPAELKPAFATLTQAVQQANGKSAADATAILQSSDVTKASDTIKAWVDKNCAS